MSMLTEDPDSDKPPNRKERMEKMRSMIAAFVADGNAEFTEQQTAELIQWAGMEFAALDHLADCGRRVIRAMHPSIPDSDQDKRDTEVVMYLLETAAHVAKKCTVPKDLLVKNLMVCLGSKNPGGVPEADEQAEFDQVLFGSSN